MFACIPKSDTEIVAREKPTAVSLLVDVTHFGPAILIVVVVEYLIRKVL
jgi:hypothetical protein